MRQKTTNKLKILLLATTGLLINKTTIAQGTQGTDYETFIETCFQHCFVSGLGDDSMFFLVGEGGMDVKIENPNPYLLNSGYTYSKLNPTTGQFELQNIWLDDSASYFDSWITYDSIFKDIYGNDSLGWVVVLDPFYGRNYNRFYTLKNNVLNLQPGEVIKLDFYERRQPPLKDHNMRYNYSKIIKGKSLDDMVTLNSICFKFNRGLNGIDPMASLPDLCGFCGRIELIDTKGPEFGLVRPTNLMMSNPNTNVLNPTQIPSTVVEGNVEQIIPASEVCNYRNYTIENEGVFLAIIPQESNIYTNPVDGLFPIALTSPNPGNFCFDYELTFKIEDCNNRTEFDGWKCEPITFKRTVQYCCECP